MEEHIPEDTSDDGQAVLDKLKKQSEVLRARNGKLIAEMEQTATEIKAVNDKLPTEK